MHRLFRESLPEAFGTSELLIAAFADIRGFSQFNERVESVESAVYVKRVYLRMLNEYYSDATFFKPTGDGLMLIWRLDEGEILGRSTAVLEASLRLVDDFPEFCSDEMSVNFEVPKYIGVGLSRGAASRLGTADQTLDYSGRLLNQTARLMDLARPEGLVVHGNYGMRHLPEGLRDRFEDASVFVKGVAEDTPIRAHYLRGRTVIRPRNLKPIAAERWKTVRVMVSASAFGAMKWYRIELPVPPPAAEQVVAFMEHRHLRAGDVFLHRHAWDYGDEFQVTKIGGIWRVRVNCPRVAAVNADKGCEFLDDAMRITVTYPEE